MAKFVNLTPHVLSVYDVEGKNLVATLPPSGEVARCSVETEQVGEKEGIALFTTSYGEVTGLPEEESGTILVVSGMVRAALPTRTDLASPGQLIRDADGRPMGCQGLAVNR